MIGYLYLGTWVVLASSATGRLNLIDLHIREAGVFYAKTHEKVI